MTHLIAENHQQNDDVWIVKVAEIISGITTEGVKDGLHSLSALSNQTLQFMLPGGARSWVGC